jgi:hypothetical protein
MKAKDLLPLWLLAAVFSAALLLGCSKSKPEEQVPYWVEEGEPAQNSKEELAKWHQESVDLMKALQTLEVTSKGTGKKRKVIWFTDSTLEKAKAAARRLYTRLDKEGDGESGTFLQKYKNSTQIISWSESSYFAESILGSVGNLAGFLKENVTYEENKRNSTRVGRASHTVRSYKFLRVETHIESKKGIEDSNEYKVEGKTGSLVARFTSKSHDVGENGFFLVSRSLQENGLSIVDFVGGLLEEGNNMYTLIICADRKGEEFSVYLIVSIENSDKEKAGSDE